MRVYLQPDPSTGLAVPAATRALTVAGRLLALARPRLLPFVLFLPVVGFGWAHWDRALSLRGEVALAGVVLAWALLHAGSLWLNAALDRDQGELLLGRPVPVPASIVSWAYAALAAAVLMAWLAHPAAGLACAACAVLAILYSHPATAWKGRSFLGPLVNVVGYGLLSTLAGWAVVGVRANPRTLAVWVLGALGVLGCYFMAQAFQAAADRGRGYRTLVATHGPGAVLLAARLCLAAGFLGGFLLAAAGWLPRLLLLGWPLGCWIDRSLARWALVPGGGDARQAQRLACRLLTAAVVAIALAYADYFWALALDLPVAGSGTAAGHPE
jgi:hypothetical protein